MSSDKPAVDEETGAQSARAASEGLGWKVLERAVWLGSISVELAAVLVVILDIALNEVVDWIMQLCCISFLFVLVIRAANLRTESWGQIALGFMGVALHVPTASHGSGLGIFGCLVYSWMIVNGITLAVVTLWHLGFGKLKDWTLRCPPYLDRCVGGCGGVGNRACNNHIFTAFSLVFRVLATFLFGLVFLWFLAMSIFFFTTEDFLAAVGTYDAAMVLPATAIAAGLVPPMEVGTADNIDLGPIPADLSGIWWMRWNQGEPLPLYAQMHVSETVTFAGAYLNQSIAAGAPVEYPVLAHASNRLKHRWGFSNSLAGRIAMMSCSENATENDPSQKMSFEFNSDSQVIIHGGGDVPLSMYKLNENEWLRRAEIEGEPDLFYTLTRIVYGNGTAHPEFFDAFVRHMGGTKLRVWTSDDLLCRECGSRPAGSESKCSDVCAAPSA